MTIETLRQTGNSHTYTGLAGIDAEKLKTMRNASLRQCFNRLEETRYRLEFVARVRGREYINDAASRTINATWYALEHVKGGIVWIADANKQKVDYSRLVPPALRKVRMLAIVGEGEDTMEKVFCGIIPTIVKCSNMREAVGYAYRYDADDVKVLYSPACYDGRPSAELGEAFRAEVNEL